MIFPTIHLYGTSKERLLDAIERAVREHSAWMQERVDIASELQQIAEHIALGGAR